LADTLCGFEPYFTSCCPRGLITTDRTVWRLHSHRKRRGGGKGPLSSTNREGETAKQVSMENDQNNPTYLKFTSYKDHSIYIGKRRRRKICTPYLEAVADSSLECRLTTMLVIEVPQGMRGRNYLVL